MSLSAPTRTKSRFPALEYHDFYGLWMNATIDGGMGSKFLLAFRKKRDRGGIGSDDKNIKL